MSDLEEDDIQADDVHVGNPLQSFKLERSELGLYKMWEEFGMKDSRLLKFGLDIKHVEEFSWSKAEAQQCVPDYQELYNLAKHLLQLLAAWNARVERVEGDWEDLEQRKQFISLPNWEEEGEGQNNWQGIIGERSSKALWKLNVKEKCLKPDERARYSVGRLMKVLGCNGEAEMFKKEVERVRKLVKVLLRRVLSPLLPWLPHIALPIVCEHLCEEEGGLDSLCLEGTEGTSVLVERKYIVRLYQTLDHLYRGVREMMFKHAMQTSAPWYPVKFKGLRSRLVSTISLLETLHKIPHRGGQASIGVEKLFAEVTREVPVHKEEFDDFNVPGQIEIMPRTMKEDSVVSDGHLFFPIRLSEGSLHISIQNLASGELFSSPLLSATTLSDLKKESRVGLNTNLAVNGDLVAYTVTVGYPRNYVSSRDIIKVFNWVKQEWVWQLEVPHSSGMKDTASKMEELYDSEIDEMELDDFLNVESHIPECQFDVEVCSGNGSMYIAHSVTYFPADSSSRESRLFKQGVEGVFMEFEDIYIMDFHRGFMVFKKKDENDRRILLIVVMDIEGGKEVGLARKEGRHSVDVQISRLPGPLTVLEYDGIGDTLNIYVIEKEERVLVKRVKLHQEGELRRWSDFRLVDDDLLHLVSNRFGHSSKTPSRWSARHILVDLSHPLQPLVDVSVSVSVDSVDSVVAKEEWKKESMDVIHMSADKVVFLGKNPILINFHFGKYNFDAPWKELVVKTTQLKFIKSAEEMIRWDMDMASKQTLDKAREKDEIKSVDEEQE